MTHGIGFDRSYWDFPFNNYNYSYVARAVDEHGYSTLTWDRLGIGASSKGDPLNEIQVNIEIAALKALTHKAREGSLPGCGCGGYSKVVHLGHSFGSVISYALANEAPELTDAIVLTGFTQATAYLPWFAVSNNFIPVTDSPAAGKYPPGYVATASTVSVHTNFFSEGDFDPEMLEEAYKKGQPVTPGELLTLGGPAGVNNTYTGPVQIVTGCKLPSTLYQLTLEHTLTSSSTRSSFLRRQLLLYHQRRRRPSFIARLLQEILHSSLAVQHDRCSWCWPWIELCILSHFYLRCYLRLSFRVTQLTFNENLFVYLVQMYIACSF